MEFFQKTGEKTGKWEKNSRTGFSHYFIPNLQFETPWSQIWEPLFPNVPHSLSKTLLGFQGLLSLGSHWPHRTPSSSNFLMIGTTLLVVARLSTDCRTMDAVDGEEKKQKRGQQSRRVSHQARDSQRGDDATWRAFLRHRRFSF